MTRNTSLAAALLAAALTFAGCNRCQFGGEIQYDLQTYASRAAGDDSPGEPAGEAESADRVALDATGPTPWLAAGSELASELSSLNGSAVVYSVEADDGTSDPSDDPTIREDKPYVPYEQRIGPAYPGDWLHSFGRDAKEFLPMVWDDTKAVATNPGALVLLGSAGAAGIALSGPRGNDQVERHFSRNGGQLSDFWDTVGDVGGNPGVHFAVAGAMYFGSLATEDNKTYEVSKSMLSALSINGLATLGLKAAARTESPNGDEYGWPSGHTSSSFCFAAVMYEHYGPEVGLPLYAFAAFVGYERIDARNHDFHDVISGALIGMAIGHAVAQNHEMKVLGMDVLPYSDGKGTVGLLLTRGF